MRTVTYCTENEETPGLMALSLASHAHALQVRSADGGPYIEHPVKVAVAYGNHALASQTGFIAALLHDVIEDNPVYAAPVQDLFGEEMAQLVQVLTKSSTVARELRSAEAFARLQEHVANTADVSPAIIKLADRCHNALTSRHFSAAQRDKMANECEMWYAPLAATLGLKNLGKWLQDPALWAKVRPENHLDFMKWAFVEG